MGGRYKLNWVMIGHCSLAKATPSLSVTLYVSLQAKGKMYLHPRWWHLWLVLEWQDYAVHNLSDAKTYSYSGLFKGNKKSPAAWLFPTSVMWEVSQVTFIWPLMFSIPYFRVLYEFQELWFVSCVYYFKLMVMLVFFWELYMLDPSFFKKLKGSWLLQKNK